MIKKLVTIISFLSILSPGNSQCINFDESWRFSWGEKKGAEQPVYDDSSWRMTDVPHDWSIEDLPETMSPFSIDAPGKVSAGYTIGGTGWYRKTFHIPESWKSKRISIRFDGVYMNSEIWINGNYAGGHHYGYTSFVFDITEYLVTERDNLVAVKVSNTGRNSRWYSGSGIYRHVWLDVNEPLHFGQWEVKIESERSGESQAQLNITAGIKNETGKVAGAKLLTIIKDKTGHEICRAEQAEEIGPGVIHSLKQNLKVDHPNLWSPDSPYLYTAINQLLINGHLTDADTTHFGIRFAGFSAEEGFVLNGKSMKLKGGCVHHDNGPLGAKAYDRAEERRVEILKKSGFNAVRCAHNPPSPAFLDACDRLGLMVIDEAFDMWKVGNNPDDYHLYFDECWESDIESFVKRDINHPSVIMWSIGNEIHDMDNPETVIIEKMLADKVRSLDPSRPVTAAVNNLNPKKDAFFSNLDVCGYNYAAGGDHKVESLYHQDHNRIPSRIMFGSESYPLESFRSWMDVTDNTFVTGDFVWTAFDYIGEASIGWRGYWQEEFFPWNLAYCGDIDICGWKRPQSYYRDALWKPNQISVFVTPPEPSFPLNPRKQSWSKWEWHDVTADWNWPGMEGKIFKVTVYSSCPAVELFLNGRSLGKKENNRNTQFICEWDVPYAEGELKALGYTGNTVTSESRLKSAGKVTAMIMHPDRTILKADGQDLSYITLELTDSKGTINPKSDRLIRFRLEGEGSVAAVGNADPMSIESYQLPQRQTWHGRCLVIVRSGKKAGQIRLTATAGGLAPETITLQTRK